MLNTATTKPPAAAPTTEVSDRDIWWIAFPAWIWSPRSTSGISPCAVGLVADARNDDIMQSAITGQIQPVAANGIMAMAETPRTASTIESVRNPGMRSSRGAEAKPPSA